MQVVSALVLVGIHMVELILSPVHHMHQDTLSPVHHQQSKQMRVGCLVKDDLSGQELHPEHSRVQGYTVAHKYLQLLISRMAHRFLQPVISHMELNFPPLLAKVMERKHLQARVSLIFPHTPLHHVVGHHLHYFLPRLLLLVQPHQHLLPELKLLHGEKEVF